MILSLSSVTYSSCVVSEHRQSSGNHRQAGSDGENPAVFHLRPRRRYRGGSERRLERDISRYSLLKETEIVKISIICQYFRLTFMPIQILPREASTEVSETAVHPLATRGRLQVRVNPHRLPCCNGQIYSRKIRCLERSLKNVFGVYS